MATVAVVGAGPAGLAAVESAADQGLSVVVFEAMPSPARKFLMAGLGGLNITHSEDIETFLSRYGGAAERLRPMLEAFTPADLRAWCADLGEETFVGTSGRVFPESFKASPLLRAWLRRLADRGVELRTRKRWTGWDEAGALTFADGSTFAADKTVLALGGASWPRLGSTGEWSTILAEKGVEIVPFGPSNCGFEVAWSARMLEAHEGKPLKNCLFSFGGQTTRAEAVITAKGIEGGAIYALSASLRETLAQGEEAKLLIDLVPDLNLEALHQRLSRAKSKDSLSNRLRKAVGLNDVQRALFFEAFGPGYQGEVAEALKTVPLAVTAPFNMDRAISSSGGVAWEALNDNLSLKALPDVSVCGEMVDWEAPTGGYLLQACFASGSWAGKAFR